MASPMMISVRDMGANDRARVYSIVNRRENDCGDCADRSRLRVGEVRVFYDVSGATVEVLAIVAKSEAELWLAQFGNLE